MNSLLSRKIPEKNKSEESFKHKAELKIQNENAM